MVMPIPHTDQFEEIVKDFRVKLIELDDCNTHMNNIHEPIKGDIYFDGIEMEAWLRFTLNHIRQETEKGMMEKDVDAMVSRFLWWKLPKDFNPDAGISFNKDFNMHTAHPMKHEPVGTNLFTATQATEMVKHMLGLESDNSTQK